MNELEDMSIEDRVVAGTGLNISGLYLIIYPFITSVPDDTSSGALYVAGAVAITAGMFFYA